MARIATFAVVLALAPGCGGNEDPPPTVKTSPNVQNLTVASDYGQIYVYDPAGQVPGSGIATGNPLDSLDDAYDSGRFIGYAGGVVDIVTPSQYDNAIPLRLEVLRRPPRLDTGRWDHVVEVPLPMPSGQLVFEASGGGPRKETTVAPGTYRARVSGRGFRQWVGEVEGKERYRIQLWLAPEAPPKLLKRWPGYDVFVEAG